MSKIFRYKFEENIISEMNYFAKLHSHDTRDDFNEAWDLWKKENDTLIQRETMRLSSLGYNGNVIDKMYKSVRYYYRKKDDTLKNVQPKARKVYISLGNDILNKIDSFIAFNSSNDDFKPSTYLIRFIEENLYDLEKEGEKLNKNHNISRNEFEEKLKKTFKNRYYLHSKRQKNQQTQQ